MVDITDPVQTIVSLLKSSSTGIGTTGYEITNDAGTALTISNGDILVSYALSREELKNLFGGSQDYDVIITVRKGEVEDDWIGLSTKQWKVPVIIEVNIIDKWSGAGSNLQTITAVLVREKAENAIRKFIKNKTNAPGGSVHRWLGKTYRDEEDRSLKPIIFKCTITTESWTYYDPPIEYCPAGEQITGGGLENTLEGWDSGGYNTYFSDYNPHGGSWILVLGYDGCSHATSWIKQTLSSSIRVACVELLRFYAMGTVLVTLSYEDNPDQEIECEGNFCDWTEFDLTSDLIAGKALTAIKFANVGADAYIDDVTLEGSG